MKMSSADLASTAAEPFRVFVGYASREDMAYHVCPRSPLRCCSSIPPAAITPPVVQQELRDGAGLYRREGELGPTTTESTELCFTRFLTPHLAGYYSGCALLVDCDLFAALARLAADGDGDPRHAVLCVHHDYTPTETDGAALFLFDCGHSKNRAEAGSTRSVDLDYKNRSAMLLFDCGFSKNRAALTRTRGGSCFHLDYTATEATKMDGAVQTAYSRKNWSSYMVVLFDCGHPKNRAALTPEAVVSTRSGACLHSFMRLDDDDAGEAGMAPRAVHPTPHHPISVAQFSVGQSKICNLWLKDQPVSKVLCMLRRLGQGGSCEFEVLGKKGMARLNGRSISHMDVTAAPTSPDDAANGTCQHNCFGPDTHLGVEIGKIATYKRRPVLRMITGSTISEFDLTCDLFKALEDQRDLIRDLNASTSVPPSRCQAFKDGMKQGIINPSDIDVTFENFLYYLSENKKNVLLSCAFIHLEKEEFIKQFAKISSINQQILLSGPAGSEIYQETLVKALVKHFGSRLLFVDLLPGAPSKDPESQKDVGKADKSGDKATAKKFAIYQKHRSLLADTVNFRRPAAPISSVNADIVGTSTLHSVSPPKQESSTATSKSYTFREGDRVLYVGPTQPSSSQRGPSYGYRGRMMLAFEDNKCSKIDARFDKQLPDGNDIGGLCEEDHGFFCSAELLCPYFSGGEEVKRLAMTELIEVISEENKSVPLIVLLKDVEKSLSGVTESLSSLRSKLESLPSGVLFIGSHTQMDSRKEKAHPGGSVFTKFASSSQTHFDLFPDSKIWIQLQQDEALLTNWTQQLDSDIETLKAKSNIGSIRMFLSRNGIECNDLEELFIKDQSLSVDKIVGYPVSYHLKHNKIESSNSKDAKLVLTSESLKCGLNMLQSMQSDNNSSKKSLKDVVTENEFEKIVLADVIIPNNIRVTFDDIGALENVKNTLKEMVILSLQRSELFCKGQLVKKKYMNTAEMLRDVDVNEIDAIESSLICLFLIGASSTQGPRTVWVLSKNSAREAFQNTFSHLNSACMTLWDCSSLEKNHTMMKTNQRISGGWLVKNEWGRSYKPRFRKQNDLLVPIFVKHTHTSRGLVLRVNLNQSSQYLMNLYEEKTKTKLDCQYFVYGLKRLEPDRTLLFYGIGRDTTVFVCTRLLGGKVVTIFEYLRNNADKLLTVVTLPDGRVSLMMTKEGCLFLSTWLKCFTRAFADKKSWNGDFSLEDFRVKHHHVLVIKTAECRLDKDSMVADLTKLIFYIKNIFSWKKKDSNLVSQYAPYLENLTTFLGTLKSSFLTDKDRLFIETHMCCTESAVRGILLAKLRRKSKALSGNLQRLLENEMDRVDNEIKFVDAHGLSQTMLYKYIIEYATNNAERYSDSKHSSFRLMRDGYVHGPSNRFDKSRQPWKEKFKNDDGIELMIPAKNPDLVPDVILSWIRSKLIDVEPELRAAQVRCPCPICHPSHPGHKDEGESSTAGKGKQPERPGSSQPSRPSSQHSAWGQQQQQPAASSGFRQHSAGQEPPKSYAAAASSGFRQHSAGQEPPKSYAATASSGISRSAAPRPPAPAPTQQSSSSDSGLGWQTATRKGKGKR